MLCYRLGLKVGRKSQFANILYIAGVMSCLIWRRSGAHMRGFASSYSVFPPGFFKRGGFQPTRTSKLGGGGRERRFRGAQSVYFCDGLWWECVVRINEALDCNYSGGAATLGKERIVYRKVLKAEMPWTGNVRGVSTDCVLFTNFPRITMYCCAC